MRVAEVSRQFVIAVMYNLKEKPELVLELLSMFLRVKNISGYGYIMRLQSWLYLLLRQSVRNQLSPERWT